MHKPRFGGTYGFGYWMIRDSTTGDTLIHHGGAIPGQRAFMIGDVDATYRGQVLNSQVQVFPVDEVAQPLVGQVLPSANTATPQQTFDVDPICTRAPECPFHTVDLASVLGTGRPVVVLLATPAYCQTTACGPILDLLVEGLNNSEIAERLVVSRATIKFHVSSILAKLGVDSRAEAVVMARQNHLIEV